MSKGAKIHSTIHLAAVSAAGVGAGMAQVPGSDYIPLTALQTSMVSAIALIHNRRLDEAAATSLLGTFSATIVGRKISQFMVGWIPGWGNAINATTAASLTEAIGWAAHSYFQNLGNEN